MSPAVAATMTVPAPLVPYLRSDIASLPRREKRLHGEALDLSSNENPHRDLPGWLEAWCAGTPVEALARHPRVADVEPVLARGLGLAADQLLLLPGADAGIRLVCEALRGQGAMLALQSPQYAAYARYSSLFGIEQRALPLYDASKGTPRFAPARLWAAIQELGEAPALVALVNPCPYTGQVLPLAEVEGIAALTGSRGQLLLVDEAYAPFAPIDHRPLLDDHGHLLLLRSYSKSHGLTGLRLGAMLGPAPLIEYLRRFEYGNMISGPGLGLLTLAEERRAERAAMVRRIQTARDALADRLVQMALTNCRSGRAPAWQVLPSQASFLYLHLDSASRAQRAVELLLARGIAVRAFAGEPGWERGLRITARDADTDPRLIRTLEEVVRWPP
jgi:histidinol-phosphate aminotransferase